MILSPLGMVLSVELEPTPAVVFGIAATDVGFKLGTMVAGEGDGLVGAVGPAVSHKITHRASN